MKRDTSLQVKMTEEEKELVFQLANDYGLNGGASELVRYMVQYFNRERPVLTVALAPRQAKRGVE